MKTPSQAEPMKMPPMIHLGEEDLAAIKDWKVGAKYRLIIDVEQTESSMGMMTMPGEKKDKMHASFKVLKVRNVPLNDKEYKEEEMEHKTPARDMKMDVMKKKVDV